VLQLGVPVAVQVSQTMLLILQVLPEDIRVLGWAPVGDAFNAR
jgi:tRNA U38,U39,U40 pseudouridine synthase TruA